MAEITIKRIALSLRFETDHFSFERSPTATPGSAPRCKLDGPSPTQQIRQAILCFHDPPSPSRQPHPVQRSLRRRGDSKNGRRAKDEYAQRRFESHATAKPS